MGAPPSLFPRCCPRACWPWGHVPAGGPHSWGRLPGLLGPPTSPPCSERQEKVSISVPRSPQPGSSRDGESSSSHPLAPRGGCFLLGPQHSPRVGSWPSPGSHLILGSPSQGDVTSGWPGRTQSLSSWYTQPCAARVRAGEQRDSQRNPGYSHLKKRHQAGRNSDRSAHLPRTMTGGRLGV